MFRQRQETKLCNIEQLLFEAFLQFDPQNTSLIPCNIIMVVVKLIKATQNNNNNINNR